MAELGDWFEKRRESRILELLKKHTFLTKRAMGELLQISKGNGNLEKVKGIEREADEIRRHVREELTKGELNPIDREDLLELIRNMDLITNFTYNAAKGFYLLKKVKVGMKGHLVDMCDTAKECIDEFSLCVELISHGEKEKALKTTDEVEVIEERMDDKYAQAKEMLFKETGTAPEIFVLTELLFAIEGIADSCEHSCDILRAMLIKVRW